jgi:tRNA threonylcarbamoyladenosine biosynthesis protein TsaB
VYEGFRFFAQTRLFFFKGGRFVLFILGLDTTTLACSTALLRDDLLLAEFTLNIKKTHSERLMPLIDALLRECAVEREQLQAVAAAAGPGSFTGIRIGLATARGLAQGLAIPAVGVSTLEALAEAVIVPEALVCPLLDARRSQVYTALYRREPVPGQGLELLIPPVAVELSILVTRLSKYNQPIVFTGEGLQSYSEYLTKTMGNRAILADAPLRLNRAGLVAWHGRRLLAAHAELSYRELQPFYLRRPEAERLAETEKGDKPRVRH